MKLAYAIAAASLLGSAPLAAQVPQGGPAGGNLTAVNSVQFSFDVVRGHLMRTAEQAPESLYAYRPTPEVRSFGQLLAHIADAHHMVCGAALGKEVQPPGAERNATSKMQIIEALSTSYAGCEEAFRQADSDVLQPVTLFGMQTSRLGALTLAASHDWEHYGNLVTYMRLNGLVPPSSQR
jgi:uncharacterized damage-inducible protein DinB